MKKLFLILCACFTLLCTSCDTYAQISYSPSEIEYEYTYDNRPVFLVDGVYYWYVLVNNVWQYQPLPRHHWSYVYHFDRPRRMHFDRHQYRPFDGHRPVQHLPYSPKPQQHGGRPGDHRSSTRETVHHRPIQSTPHMGGNPSHGGGQHSRGSFAGGKH